ncbi:MAG TPA: alpha-galactosidase [Verrucomicrobiae bacterium]|jgi:hypothetical protein
MFTAAFVFLLVCCARPARAAADWLIDPSPFKAKIVSGGLNEITLENGLIRRVFRLAPNAASVAFDDLMNGQSLLRAIRPEAEVTLDGAKLDVGGLAGPPIENYLTPEWAGQARSEPGALPFVHYKTGRTEARFPWKKRLEWMPSDVPWPPPGVSLTLEFARGGIAVDVNYELYDGLPLLSKWITVHNRSNAPVRLDRFKSEILAAVESQSIVDPAEAWMAEPIEVETDYSFGGMSPSSRGQGFRWAPDPSYKTQVNFELKTPCLLECSPSIGPAQIIPPEGEFESFRSFELVHDSTDRERQGLARRRMYRVIAPWVTENPILFHATSSRPEAVKRAVDQCAEAGFEMVILSFGSGFNMESRDANYQAEIKNLVDYARSKNIALGGYSLLASRGAANPSDNTQGSPARFGVMPCLGAKWGIDYIAQLKQFIATAGLGVLENDGSYPGDLCAATNHPGHRGLDDSQWAQWKAISGFYEWCRGRGVYLNVPDWYFLDGSSKTGMGYREDNWSLPRQEQEIIERQNIFDGAWDKTPSMGWMFVPLTEYHGGGAAATIEPLKDHLAHYQQRLADLFGAGVIACYRGPRLYDAPETEAVVKKWVDFYKRHRAILNSDILHLRRADGRDLDYILHANPSLKEKGLLMVYNPLERPVKETLRVPLYYTGLSERARVSERDAQPRKFTLARDYSIELPVNIAARGVSWFVIE